MARSITAALNTKLLAAVKRPIFLIEALFDTGALRLWSGLGTLTWNSNTWVGTGRLLQFSPVQETADIIATGLNYTLSGLDAAILALVDVEQYQGRIVKLYFGAMTAAGAIVADPYELHRGKADTMNDEETGETTTVALSVESVLIDLEKPVLFRYTSEDQKLIDSTDTFCDFVVDLQQKNIIGKEGD